MYKVFFNDRTVFFGDDFSKAFKRNKGLFYKFNNFGSAGFIQKKKTFFNFRNKLTVNGLVCFFARHLMI